MKILLIIGLLCTAGSLAAQSEAPDFLRWQDVRQRILQYHPLARQAELLRAQAEASLLQARGGFDPKLFADHTSKYFDGKSYFNHTETGVKWSSWLGLELKAGYNAASGQFLNPESQLPAAGQAVLGLTWTLGQGLLIDERRAALAAGRINIRQLEAERAILLNELMLEGAKAYWNWVLASNQLAVYEGSLEQANIRFNAIRESFIAGDKPAVDTIETLQQVQNRQLDIMFGRLELQNAELALSNFLWDENQNRLLPTNLGVAPLLALDLYPIPNQSSQDSIVRLARSEHPELRQYLAKLEYLEVERRLKNEKRKPVADVEYNILGQGWQFFQGTEVGRPVVLANDVKWGLRFSYPILNRKARGDYQITMIKIAQTDLALQQKRISIENKVNQYRNELKTLAEQTILFRDFLNSYQIMLDAEMEKFNYGESSIFLLNQREQRLLDTRLKWLKLLSEYRKAEMGLLWSAGLLYRA